MEKQQHFIPKCYSKHFCNSDGYVFAKDLWTGKIFPAHPKNFLKKGYLYTQPVHAEGRFDNALEIFLERNTESGWPNLVSKIESGDILNETEWRQVIRFMFALRLRVPNTIKATLHLIKKEVIKTLEKTNNIDGTLPLLNITTMDAIKQGAIRIKVDPHLALLSWPHLLKSNRTFMNINCGPSIVINKTKTPFLSTDNPVIFHGLPYKSNSKPYEHTSNYEIIFPISSWAALWIKSTRTYKHLDLIYSSNTIERINNKLVKYADRYIYAADNNTVKQYGNTKHECPVPDDSSVVSGPRVLSINYIFGEPLDFDDDWVYDFEKTNVK